MLASEIIFHKPSDPARIAAQLESILDYALLSLPFTVNRMRIDSVYGRLLNIAKGKLAEAWLEDWSEVNRVALDFNSGSTPFWQRDLFDFQHQGYAYDLKNNFIRADGLIPLIDYLRLPALVPNRHERDQWSQRVETSNGSKAFLFSFMSQGAEGSKTPMLKLRLHSPVENFLRRWCAAVSDPNPETAPYSADDFWEALAKIGAKPTISLQVVPTLVVTGEARATEFEYFEDTDDKEDWGYAHYGKRWYTVRNRGGLSFCGGLIQTRIRNATCPVEILPPFRK